ncbi:MAG: hypothetical protein A2048_04860 [Deltaproteobacteria bacterium GWA2_45_12]|nr:MAG: hypothetical protein A2048_04860 [Deltaproteobacteria bacterium GWA2_45_12]
MDLAKSIPLAIRPESPAQGAFSTHERETLLQRASSPEETKLIQDLDQALKSQTPDGYLLSEGEEAALTSSHPQVIPALFKQLRSE